MSNPILIVLIVSFFFFNDPAPTEIYTLSLHDALPIFGTPVKPIGMDTAPSAIVAFAAMRSEEHTSELQSRFDLVCRLLLEKKKKQYLKNAYSVDTQSPTHHERVPY